MLFPGFFGIFREFHEILEDSLGFYLLPLSLFVDDSVIHPINSMNVKFSQFAGVAARAGDQHHPLAVHVHQTDVLGGDAPRSQPQSGRVLATKVLPAVRHQQGQVSRCDSLPLQLPARTRRTMAQRGAQLQRLGGRRPRAPIAHLARDYHRRPTRDARSLRSRYHRL